jgi:CHAT domain-containing protein
MLLELRRETEAASTLAQAEKLYRQWGAPAKARALEETRRQLVSG